MKEGVTFYLKYLGSTLVEELEEEGVSYGDTVSPDAVKTIVNMVSTTQLYSMLNDVYSGLY